MSKTLTLLLSSLIPFSLFSNTYIVTNNNDSGAGSLRQAILDSNTVGGSNDININAGLGTITLASSLPIITNQATIVGLAEPQVLNASGHRAFFFYSPDTTLTSITISNITIQNGNVTGGSGGAVIPSLAQGAGGGGGAGLGGAVFVPPDSTMTLHNMTFTSNRAVGGPGGSGPISSLNAGAGGGGGIFGGGGSGTGTSAPSIISGLGGGGGLQGNGGRALSFEAGAAGGGGFGGNGDDTPGIPNGGPPNGGAAGCPGANGGPGGGGGGSTTGCPGGNGGNGGGGGGGSFSAPYLGACSSNGGFGGGGGGVFDEFATSNPACFGMGGFGGGGGGIAVGRSGVTYPSGGFGGGAGGGGPGLVSLPGFAGGSSSNVGGGGGGGLGGAIFVYQTSYLLLMDPAFSGNSATGGLGGTSAQSGMGFGQDIFLMSGGTLEFNISVGPLVFLTPIESDQGAGGGSGGGLIKSGAGILDFSMMAGAHTYTGGTTINQGTLKIANNGNLGDASGSVTLGDGTLEITMNSFSMSRATSLTAGGSIAVDTGLTTTWTSGMTGPGGFTKQGAGTLNLTGSNSYVGATTVAQGILAVNGSITSDVSVLANAILQVTGTITGNVSVLANAISQMNGTITGDVSIFANAFLQGNGTIIGNVSNTGTITPGNSIGVLNVIGDITFNSGSVLQIELTPSTADLLNVSSNVTILPGATLELFPTPSESYVDGSQFTIVNGGSVTGTFSNLIISFPLAHHTILYFPTHIDLLLGVGSFAEFTTGNAHQIAQSLTGVRPVPGTDLFFVFQQLYSLDPTQLNPAFNEMQPSLLTGLSLSQQNNFVLISSTLRKRTNTLHEMTCASQDRERPWSIWGDVSGGFFFQEHQNDQVGFHSDSIVGAAGIDCVFLKHLYVGILGAYTYSDIDWSESLANGRINSYYGGAYGSWLGNLFYMNLSVIAAYNRYHNSRKISFAAIDRHAKATHHGDSITGHIDLGFMVPKGENFQFYPFGQLDYIYIHQARYREHGAQSLDLVMDESSATMLRSEVGIGGRYCIPAGKNYIVPSIKLSWVNEARFKGKHLTARLIDVPNQFTVSGIYPTRNLIAPGATLMGSFFSNALNISLSYEGEYSKKTDYNSCNLSFIWNY